MREPIWLTLTRMELAVPVSMPLLEELDVGDEDIVADELDLGAEFVGERFPILPIAFRAAVFDADDGIFGASST